MSDGMMQAVVLTKDFKLEFQKIPIPKPGSGQVRVAVAAAALNRRDYWITQKLYPKIKVPVVLGSDGSGKVVELGEDVDPKWLGEQIVINPTNGWEGSSVPAMHDLSILGMPLNGTLAEYVVVDATRLQKKPSHLSDVEAASVPLAGVTAYRALFKQGQAKRGSSVFVTGIGSGVSSFAAQFAAAAGCKVVVSSSSQEKLDQAVERHSLLGGVLYTKPAKEWTRQALELIDSKTSGGFDLIIDGAAGRDFNELIKLLKPGGAIVSYGGTAGKPTDFDIFRVFLLQLRILGTSMGSDQDFQEMIQFVADHRIIPVISETHPLSAATKAISDMETSKSRGKVAILVNTQCKL